MSTCISRHGEYGFHTPDDEYTCTLCGVLDEAGLVDELRRLREGAGIDEMLAGQLKRARSNARSWARMAGTWRDERDASREVVTAARRLVEHWTRPERPGSVGWDEAGRRARAMLTGAVRNLGPVT